MANAHLHEDSKLAAYTPDLAAEIDGDSADIIERFAEVAQGWHGLPPQTRLGFEKAVVGIFIRSLERGIFDEAHQMGEEAAYDMAAVMMFRLLDMVTAHENPVFLKACLGFAIGAEPRSQVEVAAAFGVERATVSKWSRRFVEMLQIEPGRGMRRPQAVRAYQERAFDVWAERKAG